MGLVLIDGQCFSHGQVYVAFSRVTKKSGIKIFSPQTCKGAETDYIVNIVYHELLDVPVQPQRQHYDPDELEFGAGLQLVDYSARAPPADGEDDGEECDLPC